MPRRGKILVAPGETRRKNVRTYFEPRRGLTLMNSGQKDEECSKEVVIRNLKLVKYNQH